MGVDEADDDDDDRDREADDLVDELQGRDLVALQELTCGKWTQGGVAMSGVWQMHCLERRVLRMKGLVTCGWNQVFRAFERKGHTNQPYCVRRICRMSIFPSSGTDPEPEFPTPWTEIQAKAASWAA